MRFRVRHAAQTQAGDGQAQKPCGFTDVVGIVPSRHGEHTPRGQRVQKVLPALYRVEPVFGERVRACAGGGPGVDQAHLDEIELVARAREPASPLIHVKAHAG